MVRWVFMLCRMTVYGELRFWSSQTSRARQESLLMWHSVVLLSLPTYTVSCHMYRNRQELKLLTARHVPFVELHALSCVSVSTWPPDPTLFHIVPHEFSMQPSRAASISPLVQKPLQVPWVQHGHAVKIHLFSWRDAAGVPRAVVRGLQMAQLSVTAHMCFPTGRVCVECEYSLSP